jgi:SAM-dependent methyltransferase
MEELQDQQLDEPPHDAATRFSNRVDNYVLYRPTYPSGVLQVLGDETGLTAGSIIADVGSGTGISAELFLRNGNAVFGVEPNADMRLAAERQLMPYPNFRSVTGKAEATSLPSGSVDYVVAAQAFHWFDVAGARTEFARILKPGGWVVLMWNSRRLSTTPFLRDYESLLQRFATDYRKVNHQNLDAELLRPLFAQGKFELRKIYNEQRLDFEGLKGRVLSSSYMPTESQRGYAEMVAALERVFNEHAETDHVCIEYDTEIYFGHVE